MTTHDYQPPDAEQKRRMLVAMARRIMEGLPHWFSSVPEEGAIANRCKVVASMLGSVVVSQGERMRDTISMEDRFAIAHEVYQQMREEQEQEKHTNGC